MNGADRLCETLLANDIGVCFANPGTSEMHFVAALDRNPEMRCILGLFEGVVTGAADGYGRMKDQPAATLLHTGPGLANGLANLHNARRAHSPIVNIVGDHASYHLPYDAPLTSDIDALAAPMSNWVHRVSGPDDVGPAAEAACRAARAMPGIATLILPGNAAWGEAKPAESLRAVRPAPVAVAESTIHEVAAALRATGSRAGIILAGTAARAAPLDTAAKIAEATGARMLGEMFIARAERGRGRPPLERIVYPVDQAVEQLRDLDLLVLVGASPPVAFFAYPGKPSALSRQDARLMTLSLPGEDAAAALEALAEHLGAPRRLLHRPEAPPPPDGRVDGALTDEALAVLIAQRLPEDAVVVDECITSVRSLYGMTAGAPPHDFVMACTGGAIGSGPPVATGAAVACPDRKVLNLQADGSAMYTLQALWTQAREKLDVVTVIFANRVYAVLQTEMRAVGVNRFGRNAERMLSLGDPVLDWVALAAGMGVEGRRVDDAKGFRSVLDHALSRPGPFLIEAVMS